MTKIFLKSRYSEWVSETKPMKQTCRGEDELRQTEGEREDKDHLIPSITAATRCTCWRGGSTCRTEPCSGAKHHQAGDWMSGMYSFVCNTP